AVECLRLTHLHLKSIVAETWPSVSVNSAMVSSLRCLVLSKKRIAWLSDHFWILEDLENNNLDASPAVSLQEVKELQNLQLGNSRLRCLPYAVPQFRNLGTLSLSDIPWMAYIPPSECDEGSKRCCAAASDVIAFVVWMQIGSKMNAV
ncbi:hypothetical protein TSMEX_004949, partial [Taenia solium]